MGAKLMHVIGNEPYSVSDLPLGRRQLNATNNIAILWGTTVRMTALRITAETEGWM